MGQFFREAQSGSPAIAVDIPPNNRHPYEMRQKDSGLFHEYLCYLCSEYTKKHGKI